MTFSPPSSFEMFLANVKVFFNSQGFPQAVRHAQKSKCTKKKFERKPTIDFTCAKHNVVLEHYLGQMSLYPYFILQLIKTKVCLTAFCM